MFRKAAAEGIGTFWLVFCGCGAAVLAAGFPALGIGFSGVALAFGLTVLTMAYSIGPVSGCHLNPAVSVGMAVAGRFQWRAVPIYVLAQLCGAIAASAMLLYLAELRPGFDLHVSGLAANGFGQGSPSGFALWPVFLTEAITTGFFVFIIARVTAPDAHAGMAPIAIGLALTLIHLVTIPVSNTSVNPARSTGPALMLGGLALQQLWVFWVAPIVGAVCGGLVSRVISAPEC